MGKISFVLNEAAEVATAVSPLWVRNCVLPVVTRIKCEDGVFKYQIQASVEIFWLTGHNLRVLIAPTSAQVYYKKKKSDH